MMRAREAEVGQLVEHRYPWEHNPRSGEVIEIREGGFARVLFDGQTTPRQVELRNLTRRS